MNTKILAVMSLGKNNGEVLGGVVLSPEEPVTSEADKQMWLNLCKERCPLFRSGLCSGMQLYPNKKAELLAAYIHGNPTALLNPIWYRKHLIEPSECNIPPLPKAVDYETLTSAQIGNFQRN